MYSEYINLFSLGMSTTHKSTVQLMQHAKEGKFSVNIQNERFFAFYFYINYELFTFAGISYAFIRYKFGVRYNTFNLIV